MRVVVKIGSNVLTRDDGSLDFTRMSALVDQIALLYRSGIEVIVVSSGAVACGRSELSVLKRLDSVSSRQLYSSVGQAKMINRYYDLFRDYNIICGQVLTTKESFSTRRHYLTQKRCISVMLESGVIPVVNENDTISVTELMFTDNDELSGLVASMMRADKLVVLSNVDGIYSGDPALEGCELIRVVDSDRDDFEQYVFASRSKFGRGGMATKARIARKVADDGVEVIIANGKRDGILTALLLGESDVACTRFTPSSKAPSEVKRWISHSDSFAKGELVINGGAYDALKQPKAISLLAVGVEEVRGDFERDDIVKIVTVEGESVGVGRVAVDRDTVMTIKGERGHKPIIHYDYLYLEE